MSGDEHVGHLDYRTATSKGAYLSRQRLAIVLLACACFASIGSLLLAFEARRQYQRAVTMPAERVTRTERLERALVRVASGFDKTYASRPRYLAVVVTTLTRVILHGMLAWQLWRLARSEAIKMNRVRRVTLLLIITAPIALVAWYFFTRNLGAVRDSFDLIGDRLGFSAALFLAALFGMTFSTVYAACAAALARPEPPVARLLHAAPGGQSSSEAQSLSM